MNLKKLVKEINYQQEYSYDKRVDLFNKYQISTSQNFFIPILELVNLITHPSKNLSNRLQGFGYSHSGNIASSFNRTLHNPPDKTLVHLENQNIQLTDKRLKIYKCVYKDSVAKKIDFITFDIINKIITIHDNDMNFTISRTLYEDIDQFLIDLGYEAW